jgi:CO/xanthine dehydrogenase Mo-binding subunit
MLRAGGALAVGFSLALAGHAANEPLTGVARGRRVSPNDVDGFLVIDAQGGVTLYSGKVELGTGALTALTQIAAEELSVPFDRVTTVQGDTLLTPDQGPTYASLSVQQGGMQIRRAAATARAARCSGGSWPYSARRLAARRAR